MKISIRKKIFSSFILMTLISSSFVIISYPVLQELRIVIESIIPDMRLIMNVHSQERRTNQLEEALERLLLVGSEGNEDMFTQVVTEIAEDKRFDLEDDIGSNFNKITKIAPNLILAIRGGDRYQSNLQAIDIYNAISLTRKASEIEMQKIMSSLEKKVWSGKRNISGLLKKMVGIEVVLLLVCVVLSLLISGVISANIIKLKTITQKVARGDLDVNFNIRSNDEIGDLSRSFSTMISTLRNMMVGRDYLDKILNNIGEMIFVLDSSGTVTKTNMAACKKLGMTSHEIIGFPMSKILEFDEENDYHDHQIVKKDGSVLDIFAIISKIGSEEDPLSEKVVVIHDYSKRKKIQEDLDETNKQLIKASHLAGMSEVATGVLHNVGNVLNSVNISLNLIKESLDDRRLHQFFQAISILDDCQDDLLKKLSADEKKLLATRYIISAGAMLQKKYHDQCSEVLSLSENIDHIKNIVAIQQNFAKTNYGVVEKCDLKELLNRSIKINRQSFERHNITVELNVLNNITVEVDTFKIQQVLVNILSNARHAVDDVPDTSEKKITISAFESDQQIQVEVVDTGIGIDKEGLAKVFEYGFTTKESGHGFGLHNCALLAKDLGGSLEAFSDGLGKGAAFTLKIPQTTKYSTLHT